MPPFERLGMIARWKPVHLGHAAVLDGLCRAANHVLIGVGSSNRYDARNPFTCEETEAMLRRALEGHTNFLLIPVPDLDDGPRWRATVADLFGNLDAFVTDNPYVASLMSQTYRLIRPVELVAEEQRVALDGTRVPLELARGEAWRELVPEAVGRYMTENALDRRFQAEFGLETLSLQASM